VQNLSSPSGRMHCPQLLPQVHGSPSEESRPLHDGPNGSTVHTRPNSELPSGFVPRNESQSSKQASLKRYVASRHSKHLMVSPRISQEAQAVAPQVQGTPERVIPPKQKTTGVAVVPWVAGAMVEVVVVSRLATQVRPKGAEPASVTSAAIALQSLWHTPSKRYLESWHRLQTLELP